MLPKTEEWDAFYAQMKRKTGLDLHDYKPGQLQRRIVSMMDSRGAKTLAEFWENLTKDPQGITWFQDKLAINVSELFRNPEKWVQMEKQILPELKSSSNRLKIWSAGCSYGAEAHSLACLLHAKFPGSHSIIGTDIDKAALDQAQRGEFSALDMRNVPQEYRKYFVQKEDKYYATADIKRYLQFRSKNLLEDNFDSGFDLICCRNVVIYFTEEAKEKLYARFFRALKPGGILFVGSTERISNSQQLGFEQPYSFFYKKPITGDKTWRNAS